MEKYGLPEIPDTRLKDPESVQNLREQRLERTRNVMSGISSRITSETLPTNYNLNKEIAAKKIQAVFRGWRDRKRYLEYLYKKYAMEEDEMFKKMQTQVEEGELLIQNHKLEVELSDYNTTRKNKSRKFESKVIKIQRFWRAYQKRKAASVEVMQESDSSSVISDYSEISESLKEHFSKVKIISKEDLYNSDTDQEVLQINHSPFRTALQRVPKLEKEDNSEYMRRVKKINFLSLAQEFAAIQRQDSSALPFVFEENLGMVEDKKKTDDLDIECTMPEMDWESLEKNLMDSAEEQRLAMSRYNEKEIIRQKLAKHPKSNSTDAVTERKQQPGSKIYSTGNMQLCFMNELTAGDENINEKKLSTSPPKTVDEYFEKQKVIKNEARKALAQVRPLAWMQLQFEKQQKRHSYPVVTGMPKLLVNEFNKFDNNSLIYLNVAQLQVIVNDIHSQIEALNEDLMKNLMERDDLHMVQDSMLVDIEDLQRRAEECAKRKNQKITVNSLGNSIAFV